MNTDELTIREAKEIAEMFQRNQRNPDNHPFEIGTAYLIRTVTHIDVGTVIEVTNQEIIMKDVSWVADTGRYHNALMTGALSEVEPYPPNQAVIIGRGALVDATRWNHPLPKKQQ